MTTSVSAGDLADRYRFGDFTETAYREVLRLARRRYAFATYRERPAGPHVLWRHDLDYSVHRALRLAEIETEEGARATYFVYLRSASYNPFSGAVRDRLRRIGELGHRYGLHFDPTAYPRLAGTEPWVLAIARERDLLQEILGRDIDAVSFHLFGVLSERPPEEDELAGMVNAYGPGLVRDYAYVSDSNGIWRFRSLAEALASGQQDWLQVLTHPEWWSREPMAPRERLRRCLEEQATSVGEDYDRVVAASGRPNVGAGP